MVQVFSLIWLLAIGGLAPLVQGEDLHKLLATDSPLTVAEKLRKIDELAYANQLLPWEESDYYLQLAQDQKKLLPAIRYLFKNHFPERYPELENQWTFSSRHHKNADELITTEANKLDYAQKKLSAGHFIKRTLERERFARRCLPTVDHVHFGLLEVLNKEELEVSGTIAYGGLVTKPFRYFMRRELDTVHIRVPLHIKNTHEFRESEINSYRRLMQDGADLWNQRARLRLPGYSVRLAFNLIDQPALAAASVTLKREYTRGPYETEHSLKWTPKSVAHEFGHFLGLDDEYAYSIIQDDNPGGCDHISFMCHPHQGELRAWHLYMILRRPICMASPR